MRKRTQLLSGRKYNPRRVELRRQDPSRIVHRHSGESGDGGGKLGAFSGPRILRADEGDDDG